MPGQMSQAEFQEAWDDDAPVSETADNPVAEVADSAEEPVARPTWLRDIDEETGYNILTTAKNLPEKLSAFRDQAFGKIGGLERELKKVSEALAKANSQVAIDPEPLRQLIEKYDPELAKLGFHEVLANAIKVSPIDEQSLSPYLEPLRQQLGDSDIGTQIVLSHYDAEDLNAIVPPADPKGNMIPETQRHKDFLTWYELQPLSTQTALERFGPKYVHALRKFEKWEGEQKKERAQSAADKTQRLAGGQQPSGGRRAGATGGPKTAEEAYYQAWNEDD